MSKSHGFIPSFFDKNLISIVELEAKSFLSKKIRIENYYTDVLESIPSIKKLLNNKFLEKASEILSDQNPILHNIELHVQMPNCRSIPPHQDNFYHCIDPLDGFKFLLPLNDLNSFNGGLLFLNVQRKFPVLKHIPSNIENFSSVIPNDLFTQLNKSFTAYEYLKGDISYHFLNSIHFSNGNNTSNSSLFLVFRFQKKNSEQDPNALKKYLFCVQNHKKILNGKLEK